MLERLQHSGELRAEIIRLGCQAISGNLVVCAATAGFSASITLGGRNRKPSASWHPSRLYPPIKTLEMSPSAQPEIHQLHEAVNMVGARAAATICLLICLPFSHFHPCFWPFINRVDHVLALSP